MMSDPGRKKPGSVLLMIAMPGVKQCTSDSLQPDWSESLKVIYTTSLSESLKSDWSNIHPDN